MVDGMRQRVAERAHQLTATGLPQYLATNDMSARLLEGAAFVTLMDDWDASDGEVMMLLILRDDAGHVVGALPAPADDEDWLKAFESSPKMLASVGRSRPRELTITPG